MIEHIPASLTAKNLKAAGKEIVAHITAGDQAKDKAVEHYKAAGLLLLDVSNNKHPKDFTAFLTRSCAGLGRSRAYELMQMAGGRKTVEQIRADTKKRVDRHRAKNKQRPLQEPVTDNATLEDKQEVAPADAHEAVPAADEPEVVPTDTPEGTPADPFPMSERAFAEFKFAVDAWMPKMTLVTRGRALAYPLEAAWNISSEANRKEFVRNRRHEIEPLLRSLELGNELEDGTRHAGSNDTEVQRGETPGTAPESAGDHTTPPATQPTLECLGASTPNLAPDAPEPESKAVASPPSLSPETDFTQDSPGRSHGIPDFLRREKIAAAPAA